MRIKLSIVFLLISFISFGQCDQQSITFNTNEELEEFIMSNPDCNSVLGINISGPDITNLALFSFFDTIYHLSISNNPRLKNLDFLNNVEVVSTISLESLDSLESLSKFYDSQPYNFHIGSCPKIKSINLTRSHYNSVTLQTPDVEVLAAYKIYIASFNLSHNVILHTEEQIKVNQIWLQGATEYTSFTSLTDDINFDTLTNLQIGGYDHFSSEGFPDSMVCKSFSMGSIKNLNSSGFENKTAFFNSLTLSNIDNLKDLNSFDGMITKKSIIIGNLDSLTSLNGIPISEYIDGIYISDNPILTDIQDVIKVNDTYRLSLIDNPQLSTCNNRLVCDLIEAPNSSTRLKISGNNTTCLDVPSVAQSCIEREPVECRAKFLGTSLYDYD
jgi:hypothetical protein